MHTAAFPTAVGGSPGWSKHLTGRKKVMTRVGAIRTAWESHFTNVWVNVFLV